ncbi:PTS system D-fructose-specific IIA component (F1P-forming), Frc family /PTS system D-fructose-specific IIB component (F1P-forming), Frc family /PTS system D-fructose-specific IIC component (F1P-forming), Frc family [Streptomyces sp. 2323.1]|uniref:PTS fructose transporter subunit IIABC n=1 Tax=Streptomyces sp. 2323.1 TaxID=1938841 RepID=UPI000BB6F62E|nr:fructose-specific PTS transporter subunit EIIC [Streptomyces sp. 2323.1]SOE13111.1 PTS system D-fructose-specific IIA component (F1P-forming), Frc family /PTS system D-fructose-specific IIB component (F1P-forming), Frc family /PTS system D-fructose-specific IIC component (F1P-forming), Frc family [Streptomyces sp. 2323.1]
MSELITAELVDLDLSAETKDAAARALAERMVAAGRVTDLAGFLADVAAREAQMPTGLDGGIGIPHCRSTHVTEPTLAFGRSAAGIDFGAPDGPADLIFLIAAPAGGDADHLSILSTLARQLMDETFTGALRSATESERTAALIRGDEAPGEPAREQTEPEPAAETADMATAAPEPPAETSAAPAGQPAPAPFRIVAVTSCPTGIAHTYMAAESLEQAGKVAGVEVAVETQGSAGFQRLDPQLVADADGVIFAHDVEVRDKERFAGKPTVDVGVKAGIGRAADLIAEVRRKAALGEGSAPARAAAPMDKDAEPGDGFATRLRKWLMTGVSYMVPFVAAGGLLIALAFAIGGYTINKAPSVADHFLWTESTSWAALLFQIGTVAFGFLVPVLAGFIAYGMADRPGLVPGFVGGAIALTVNAGFLGGLIAGLLAGAVVMAIQRVRIPAPLRGIMPVVVIPLLSSVVVGFLMFLVVGKPIAALQKGLTDWLSGLTGANAVILGALLGLMMCFDLGGPLNKVAYAFAVGGLANPNAGSLKVMAAVMAAGMVPSLAMALATTVRGRLFTKAERENGKAAWVLGASFITEGAIPFAAADPLRVIPSAMAGGAVTGALSMAFGCTLRAPHGGIFVVPLIGQPLLYLLAIAAGTGVSTALVILLKGLRKRPDTRPADSPAPDGAGVTVAA